MVTDLISFLLDLGLVFPTGFIFLIISGRLHQGDRRDVQRTTCLIVLHRGVRCERESPALVLSRLELLLVALMHQTGCLRLVRLVAGMDVSATVMVTIPSLRQLGLLTL